MKMKIGLVPIFVLSLAACGCASFYKTQTAAGEFLARGDYSGAAKLFDSSTYGGNNELLYLLDKGYVLHMASQAKESIAVFDSAKRKFEALYAKSISKEAASLLTNDYALEYAGNDFERVVVNVFQALNYLTLGNYVDALVEARDADVILKAVDSQYKIGEKNVYRDDAFVRFFMGIVYECGNNKEDLNDAYVSYLKAYELYRQGFFGVNAPNILKENLLTLAEKFDSRAFENYRGEFKGVQFVSLRDRANYAQVYLIDYDEALPEKKEKFFVVPVPGDQRVVKIAFPEFAEYTYLTQAVHFSAAASNIPAASHDSEKVLDAAAVERAILARQKAAYILKTTLKAAGRYAVEEKSADVIHEKYGDSAALAFDIVSNVFNVLVERADLRTWRTLPAVIRLSRLYLPPGHYDFYIEKETPIKGTGKVKVKALEVSAGDKKFIIVATR